MSDQSEVAEPPEQNSSDSGTTTPNSTSTYEYSQEPYETFQQKVLSVARNISDGDHVSLQRMSGGSYNRVVGVAITRGGEHVRGVFRIPRYTNVTESSFQIPDPTIATETAEHDGAEGHGHVQVEKEIHDQAAVLQFLAQRGVSAPRLLAFDASARNAMQWPYVLQECSTGTKLEDVYGAMSLEEKLSIVDELVRLLLCAEKIKLSRSGTLLAASGVEIASAASYLFTSEGPMLQVEVEGLSDTPATAIAELLTPLLEKHLEKERSFGSDTPGVAMWQRLCCIHSDMQASEIFCLGNPTAADISQSVLYHWDLEPRNILVRQSEDASQATIDMVIDWDKVQAVPPVLARKPPTWLWDFCGESEHDSIASDWDGDVDLLDALRWDVDSGRQSSQDQQIKQRFEETFVEQMTELYPGYDMEAYVEEAYGKGRWIRRIARFAVKGYNDTQDFERFKALDEDWSAASRQRADADEGDAQHEEVGNSATSLPLRGAEAW